MSSNAPKKASTFLLKTFDMLEKEQYLDIVRWNEGQDGFVVVDADRFADEVLPCYFKHNNMQSYIRQLNMYGFSKQRAHHHNSYAHPLFVRSTPQLISSITRRVEHKAPKNGRASTISIEAQLSESDSKETLVHTNFCLILEQAANLRMILDQLDSGPLKKRLETEVEHYVHQNRNIIEQAKRHDPGSTTLTLLDRSDG